MMQGYTHRPPFLLSYPAVIAASATSLSVLFMAAALLVSIAPLACSSSTPAANSQAASILALAVMQNTPAEYVRLPEQCHSQSLRQLLLQQVLNADVT